MGELQEEVLSLADEKQLLRMVNSRSGGTDLDKKKLLEKIRTSMRRLRRLGMITALGNSDKFRVNESVFRFAADVRSDEDPRAVQLRMIQRGRPSSTTTKCRAATRCLMTSRRTSMKNNWIWRYKGARQVQIPDHGQLERLLRPDLRSRPAGHHPLRRQRCGQVHYHGGLYRGPHPRPVPASLPQHHGGGFQQRLP